TQKDEDTMTSLEMVNEMYARGVEFLPINLYKSKPSAFVPENGKIRLPLIALGGLGEIAAENMYKVINDGTASTLEELKNAAGISKTVVEMLIANDCLGGMPESDQISMF
ncbi:MAG: hypothetical protein RRY76_02190, partial [Clostridia bacterium]